MPITPPPPAVSKASFRTGVVLSALPVLLLLFSAFMKFAKSTGVPEGFAHLGIPLHHAAGLGILEMACTIIYVIPRTSVLGAILVTGYLGGATAIGVRVGDSFVMTVLLGVLVWGGLFLREPRLRALIPLRR